MEEEITADQRFLEKMANHVSTTIFTKIEF